jgi:glutamine amidotransferase
VSCDRQDFRLDQCLENLRNMSQSVVIVDYGVGNVFSVLNALKLVGVNPALSSDPLVVSNADRLILPGVGSFSEVMRNLSSSGLDESIATFINMDRPFLGICVGMQVLMTASNEFGHHKGLGYFNGTVDRIPETSDTGVDVKVPHIGWSRLKQENFDHDYHARYGSLDGSYFYFVHSFKCNPDGSENLIATVDDHPASICAVLGRSNILGVQFHPERSGPDGLRFLKKFVA